MCGISAIISNNGVAKDLFTSIQNLEYRGYDSCGMALINKGKIGHRKSTGSVEEVNKKVGLTRLKGNLGIAHTRWATHGKVTKENSHPHIGGVNQFAVVHNGIFSNYKTLKKELIAKKIKFSSETDTEVFVHLVNLAYSEFKDVETAFLHALGQTEGSFATAMISVHEPDKIYCAKQDSPLILGLSEGTNYIASDINAFAEFTKRVITFNDGEYGIITKNSFEIKKINDQKIVNKEERLIKWDVQTSKKGGFSHYMLKEIFDQPYTVKQALLIDEIGLKKLADMIDKAKTTFLVGVGTTYYVALFGQYYFSELAKIYLPTISSDEFDELCQIDNKGLVIAVSQSGETYDTKNRCYMLKKGAKTGAIVNVMGSSISDLVDHVIMQGSGPEICVVSTKAAVSQVILMIKIALIHSLNTHTIDQKKYDLNTKQLEDFPQKINLVLNESSGFIRNMAKKASKIHNWLYLGAGVYYPVAMESALKMKEVTYMHVEGMPAGFLKHGTLAMVDNNLYTLMFVPSREEKNVYRRTLIAIEEIKARGGKVFGFIFDKDTEAKELLDVSISLPSVGSLLNPVLQLIAAQLFSYYTALDLGCNIDKPRNLAKSVTVA